MELHYLAWSVPVFPVFSGFVRVYPESGEYLLSIQRYHCRLHLRRGLL